MDIDKTKVIIVTSTFYFDIAIVSLDLTISKKKKNQNYSGKEIGPRKKILEILGFLGFKYEKSNRRFTSSQPLFFSLFQSHVGNCQDISGDFNDRS